MIRKIYLLCTAVLITVSAFGQAGPEISSWLQNTTLSNPTYGGPVNVQLVQYSGTDVYVSTNCIPEYGIGPWPNNPNVASPQNIVCEFPRKPVQNTGAPVYTPGGAIGLWSNGVAIFNAQDGFHWDASTKSWAMGFATSYTTGWNRNAAKFEAVSFDSCLGHPQQQGMYHNHVNPKCLYNSADSTHHSPIIGYAFDGFPIYGAYGYASTTSASGAIKRMRSSYALTSDTTRASGPHPISTYPLGDCCEDYVYTAGSGDLDAHNGRFCYTPEYPKGTYAYFVTIDSKRNPVFPFVIGPAYYGVVGSTSNHVTPTGPDTTYTPHTSGISPGPNSTIKCQIVPNPVADHAYIYMDATSMNNIKGSVYDASGKLVKTINQTMQPSIAYAVDMTSLPAGIYFMKFESGGTAITQKIIKQ